MEWTTPYAVYRLMPDGNASLVNTPEDLTKAKYWIQYIAEPMDVLCKTPIHPKHSKKSEQPEYWSHKEASGKPMTSEETWLKIWTSKGWNKSFGA
jgi:hypothetical protein